jgi:hypothetical protein
MCVDYTALHYIHVGLKQALDIFGHKSKVELSGGRRHLPPNNPTRGM